MNAQLDKIGQDNVKTREKNVLKKGQKCRENRVKTKEDAGARV
jgi:hypothetical protein